MKKLVIMLTALFTMTVSANAMSYEQARQQALFLTDKMAYELDLTEEQYEAAYEINLDYLMSVNSYDDLYGAYWTHRNLDLSYVLYDWQYTAYCAASYFYRPLYWDGGYWHFGIYARYPHRTYLYFGRPSFWVSYRGGHSWHHNGGRSWYHGRTFGPSHKPSREHHVGMRSTHKPGDHNMGHGSYGSHGSHATAPGSSNNRNGNHSFGRDGGRSHNNNGTYRPGEGSRNNDTYGRGSGSASHGDHSGYGSNSNRGGRENGGRSFGSRESSTRTTVTNSGSTTSDRPSRGFGNGNRSYGSSNSSSTPSSSFRPSGNSSSSFGGSSSRPSNRSSFGSSSSSGSRSFGSSSSSGSRSSFGGSHSSGGSRSFGSRVSNLMYPLCNK